MKYYLLFFVLAILACNGQPLVAPATPETIWIDAETHSDTVVTNVKNQWAGLYYALKNWQLSADTNLSHGYRLITVRFGDSVLVHAAGDSSTNYAGPFIVGTNTGNDTLKAQNFLDTNNTNPARIYIPLR